MWVRKNALLYFWLSKDVMTVWMFAFPPLNGGMEMTVDAVDARGEIAINRRDEHGTVG